MFPQIFGKYVLEHEIASGGMARVYLATLRGAVGFEKRLVVKQIRPELASDEAFVRRFVEEAKTTVELSHPNIVPVYELGVEQGTYYIAMEFCEGVTLAELLAETGPLSPEEGAYVGVEICRALDYAHRRASIVHRDVTPRNVIIDDEGGVRLIDFGIAAPGPADGMIAVSRAEVFGSPGHMPPEQLQGKRLTPATDVFAVGALLIEAWTGRPPFRRATLAECERALLTPPPALDRDDSRFGELSDLMSAAVALEPEARPESAELLARPMRQFLKSADLGEVERRLGERVREARRHLHTSSPWLPGEGLAGLSTRANSPAGPVTPRAKQGVSSYPPAAQATPAGAPMPVGTLTFAVREDLALWTRRMPSEAPKPGSEPPSQGEVRRKRNVKTVRIEQSPDAARSAPAAGETPSQPAIPVSRRHDEDTSLTASGSGADSARAASGWRLVAAVLAGVVIAGLLSARVFRSSSQRQPVSESSAVSAADRRVRLRDSEVASMPTKTASSVQSSADASTLALRAPSRDGGPARSGTTFAVPGAPDTPEQRMGTLILNSEPSARVSVAGRSGTTPLTLKLKSGPYTVIFLEPTLRETLTRSIELGAGETKTVVADFTAITPQVVP